MAEAAFAEYPPPPMAPDLDTEMRVFVRLVRRGVLTEDAVRPLFEKVAAAQAAGKSVSLAGMAVKRGLLDKSQALLYLRTDGEDVPELPGWTYVSKLGEGGTAHVFRVQRKDAAGAITSRAVKILKPEIAADPAEVKAFVEEARLLGSLEHENVVKGFKAGRLSERWISFMEDIRGETLLERIQAAGSMAEDDALFVILQTARALEYLRSQGVVHRDIKPGNIMVTEEHAVKLIDLGFAAQSGGDGDDAQAEGTTRGTAAYLSPEQARGEGGLDVRSDIYSLGATLYQLVLGELPFAGDDADLVRAAVLDGLSAEATKGGGLSPYVHYFIEKMMAKDRDHRDQDPAELIADIEAQIEGRAALDMPADDSEEAEADKARRKLDRMRRKRQRRR